MFFKAAAEADSALSYGGERGGWSSVCSAVSIQCRGCSELQ